VRAGAYCALISEDAGLTPSRVAVVDGLGQKGEELLRGEDSGEGSGGHSGQNTGTCVSRHESRACSQWTR
jgi:hypothetical protein